MEEKKLTDEKVVKVLECCIKEEHEDCVHCGEFVSQFDCMRNAISDSLDLIHRLNDENERLTEEHERIAWSKQQYLDWVHGFLSTHTDMKDRGEDYKMFDRDWMCGVFWEKIEGSIEYIIDLENQRNELQKQVDELTAFKNEAISMSLYGKGRKDGEEVAVKDTAKEIIKWIKLNGTLEYGGYVIHDSTIEQMCKKFGVEVE